MRPPSKLPGSWCTSLASPRPSYKAFTGFVLNRPQYGLFHEATQLVEDGTATAGDMETLVRTTLGAAATAVVGIFGSRSPPWHDRRFHEAGDQSGTSISFLPLNSLAVSTK